MAGTKAGQLLLNLLKVLKEEPAHWKSDRVAREIDPDAPFISWSKGSPHSWAASLRSRAGV